MKCQIYSLRSFSLVFLLFFLQVASLLCEPAVFVRSPLSLVSSFRGSSGPASLTSVSSLFGFPSSRGWFNGKLVYPVDSPLGCDVIPLSPTVNSAWFSARSPYSLPLIALLTRGGCDFTAKVFNAQTAGASAVIIANGPAEGGMLPRMADDGGGRFIHISSIAIPYSEGELLRSALASNPVQLQWILSQPSSDGKVPVDFWSPALDNSTRDFKSGFLTAFINLDRRINFHPRFTFGGANSLPEPCVGNCDSCTNSGRYCISTSDSLVSAGLTGSDLVRESLRQLCLWNWASGTNQADAFFRYWKHFYSDCDDSRDWKSSNCSFSVIEKLQLPGISTLFIQRCIDDSGGFESDGPENSLLQGELAINDAYGRSADLTPFLLINSIHSRNLPFCYDISRLSSCSALQEICSSYEPQNMPSACNSSPTCEFGQFVDKCGQCNFKGANTDCSSDSDSPRTGLIIFLIFLFVGVLVGGIFCHVRRQKEKTRQEIAMILAAYLPLEEELINKNEPANNPIDPALARRLGLESLKQTQSMNIADSANGNGQSNSQRQKKVKWTKIDDSNEEDIDELEMGSMAR